MLSHQPGKSIASAIRILASDRGSGVEAEYRLTEVLHGVCDQDWVFCQQRLVLHAGRFFDEITLVTKEDVEEVLYFDISSFHPRGRGVGSPARFDLPEEGIVVLMAMESV